MNSFYTKISTKVPSDLTKPTASFKKHVWLSIFGLLLFIGLYLALTIWFGKLAYNLFLDANNFDGHFVNYFLGIGFGFLSLFMAKSLFFLNKREENPMHKYIKEKDEPVLFDYLYKLADEAGAPRPHKVFLTDRVNASVSYDISLINLLLPSKKNLEIGLGLVNVLSLGEFKAVLAHEFGHFAQRSMLLGRYVYVAQQIAARIVGKRDMFDSFLAGLSRIDLRIAWIGWILSILVWSIRSLIETCFSIVVVAERALSREMEFQADLVAVSLTGSDALINALYKLQIADEAYSNTIECINEELAEKRAIKDMYALQTNYIQRMAITLDDPKYGKSPIVPKKSPEDYRVFTSKKYNPPQMWATHPADTDREYNAKKTYIFEPVDDRASWDLFSNATPYREEMTQKLIETAKMETTLISDEEAIKSQNDRHFNWTFLDSRYRSAFLGRYAFLSLKSFEDFFDSKVTSGDLEKDFKKTYPSELSEKINLLQEIKQEITALEITKNEALTVEKRRIWHRGSQIKRKDIPDILKSLQEEVKDIQKELIEHDVLCRTVHHEVAENLGKDHGDHLKQLTHLVHYAEHGIANINDIANKFNNVLSIALADGNVSSSELEDILNAANDYYKVLRNTYKHSETLTLSPELLKNMNVESYVSFFESFELGTPDRANINEWVNYVGGWASAALKALHKLRNESLELLLVTEEEIKQAYFNNKNLENKSNILNIPKDYDTLVPGNERKIQTRLGLWDRFAIGDGLVPSMAKFGISASIVFAAIFFGNYSQKLPMYVYNGLQTNVNVNINGEIVQLSPNSSKSLQLNYGESYHTITTTTEGVLIEEEDLKFKEHNAHVYNIANAGLFVEYPIFYGYSYTPEGVNDSKIVGAKKWFPTKADYILEEPPSSISLSSGSRGERKEALKGYSEEAPGNLISMIKEDVEKENIIKAHGKWDSPNSKNTIMWMYYLNDVPEGIKVAESRLSMAPKELMNLRAIQDLSDSLSHMDVCQKHTQLALDNPGNADYYYLSTRCMENETIKSNRFIEGHKKWNDHNWLAYASAHTFIERGKLKEAYQAYEISAKGNDALAELIADDAERVKRVLNNTTNSNYETIVRNDDIVFYDNLERGNIEGKKENPDYVYYLLTQGKIEEAYDLAQKFENSRAYMLRLIGASKGATKKMKVSVLDVSNNEGLNLNSVWCTLGLAVKNNVDYKRCLEFFEPLELKDGYVEKLILLIKTNQHEAVEEHLADLSLRWKAQAYTMANIIKEGNIPKQWKQISKSGLFANERPYLE